MGNVLLQINVFVLILPPLMFAAGYLKEYAAAFFSIALHEMGHIAVARLYGCKPRHIRLTPIGFSVSLNEENCFGLASVLIFLAGPAVNLVLFAGAALMSSRFPPLKNTMYNFAATNLYLALFNLIPALPLDGGRILADLLAGRIGLLAAGRLVRRLAFCLSAAFIMLGILQARVNSVNLSLVLIGLYIIILLRTGRMESALMNIRQMLYRRSRLEKRGIYAARDLVVLKSTRLADTIKNMDFDRFHLIYVLDDELRLMHVFTEYEILNAITEKGENKSFGDLLGETGASDRR